MHVRHHLTRRGFTGRVLTITAAIAATISLSTSPVLAAGPWTVSNPQGTTWTAPAAGSVLVRIAASDGYPGRETVVQAHELVVLRTAGVEVGRTPDLPDRVASATAAASFTVVVSAGQVLEVVHSSKIGLVDGTPNSVSVSTRFDFTPTPATTPSPTTVAPSTTVASSSTIAVPAPSPSSTSAPRRPRSRRQRRPRRSLSGLLPSAGRRGRPSAPASCRVRAAGVRAPGDGPHHRGARGASLCS